MPQKTYIFWILVFIIFFIAAVNFSILVIMMSVLRIGEEGMESVEIVSKDKLIKFHGDADLDQVLFSDGPLKGFQNVPFKIQSDEGSVIVSMKNINDEQNANKIRITDKEIMFSNVEKFFVYDPISRRNIFSTDYKDFKIPKGLPNLDVKKLRVKRLLSPLHSNLTVRSDSITRFRGNGGLAVQGKEISFAADGDIYLNSVNGSIYLLADNIKIDMKHVPVVVPNATFDFSGMRPIHQFKLCVCMPQGYLFKVPILNNVKSHLACQFVDLSSGNTPCTKS